jgi:hypothetical protein
MTPFLYWLIGFITGLLIGGTFFLIFGIRFLYDVGKRIGRD